ncbi:hypothetical protein COTS27_01274 [Spirochaetota bacterium]|nr:hypothetical protein COTS27_01274 [Spirochaetota bacterium]
MDVKKLAAIYQVAQKRRIRELTIETKASKVKMVLNPQKPTAYPPETTSPSVVTTDNGENKANFEQQNAGSQSLDKFDIVSSQIGFFSRYNPKTKRHYVKLRDQVKKGAVVACIKSMHLHYEIQVEKPGKIVEFLVEEGQPVEYHQPLIRLIQI